MVVISAAIVSKSKTLIARQFVDIPRLKIEGLLSSFSKLIDTQKMDCTYIETEQVRFVFQPMETLYLLIVTTRQSNIIEDLDTLRLLYKILSEVCSSHAHDEKMIFEKAFDIIFAFDEVVSFGYRESVTAGQVKTYTEMDSHEERLHQMIEKSKEQEAKEISKRKQIELTKAKAQQLKEGRGQAEHGIDTPTAFAGSHGEEEFHSNVPRRSEQPLSVPSFRSTTAGPAPAAWTPGMSEQVEEITAKTGIPKKGMSLGARKKAPTASLGE